MEIRAKCEEDALQVLDEWRDVIESTDLDEMVDSFICDLKHELYRTRLFSRINMGILPLALYSITIKVFVARYGWSARPGLGLRALIKTEILPQL